MNDVFCDKRDCFFWDVDGICNCVMHDGIPYCKSEIWDEKLSNDYDGKRFVVDGDIIELFAYEYGRRQTGVAEQFHAEPLEAYESGLLHDWTEHHDNMLRRACDALESENAKLREMANAVKEFVEDTHCEDCPFRRDCNDNNRIFCADDFSYHAFAAMRKLGIEV